MTTSLQKKIEKIQHIQNRLNDNQSNDSLSKRHRMNEQLRGYKNNGGKPYFTTIIFIKL